MKSIWLQEYGLLASLTRASSGIFGAGPGVSAAWDRPMPSKARASVRAMYFMLVSLVDRLLRSSLPRRFETSGMSDPPGRSENGSDPRDISWGLSEVAEILR